MSGNATKEGNLIYVLIYFTFKSGDDVAAAAAAECFRRMRIENRIYRKNIALLYAHCVLTAQAMYFQKVICASGEYELNQAKGSSGLTICTSNSTEI